MLQLLHEVGREMNRVGQFQQRALWISVRDDGLGVNLFSSREQHTGSRAILHANFNDFGAGANLDSGCLCGRGHRLGHCAHPACRKG